MIIVIARHVSKPCGVCAATSQEERFVVLFVQLINAEADGRIVMLVLIRSSIGAKRMPPHRVLAFAWWIVARMFAGFGIVFPNTELVAVAMIIFASPAI